MSYHYYLMPINFVLMVSTVVIAIRSFRKSDTALRLFTIFLVSSFLFETMAYLAAICSSGGNIKIYAINSLAETALICLYFNYSINFLSKYYIGIMLCIFSIATGLWSLYYNRAIGGHHVIYTLYEALLFIVLAMTSIAQDIYRIRLHENQRTHFFISITLLFFWTIAFLSWGLYDNFTALYPEDKWIIDFSLFVLNILANISFLAIYFKSLNRQR